ncbi:hypothetical protein FA95DRAFT_1577199 [Auriscalpium vulgare]|uniref:Uncharacterized protein n=1 Tax=Auriscalpium vulgare TaxID=40419 RepID=A0ACB8R7S4_9AGAM|nr:hypothetical protein FA95DRAFT_1577199 [Auriscalpium vulgare]
MYPTIQVDDAGTVLAYTDTGAPPASPYTTLFAVHGMTFSSLIFSRLAAAAHARGLRFVAVTRRNYPGSSPFTPDELNIMAGGTPAQKTKFMRARGHELARFVDAFMQRHGLPCLSADGRSGGVALMGWSLGCSVVVPTLAHVETLPDAVKARLGANIRAVILNEPIPIMLGLPTPEGSWSPILDTSVPEDVRFSMFSQWVSGYFAHPALPTRDPSALSSFVPSLHRPPSVFSMSAAEQGSFLVGSEVAKPDVPLMSGFEETQRVNFQTACFGETARALLPRMRIHHVVGGETIAFSLAAFWAVEDEDKEHGAGFINFKFIEHANHFHFWDKPQDAMQLLIDCIEGLS